MQESNRVPLTPEIRIIRELLSSIEGNLHRIGLMIRVFARVKSIDSIERKISAKADQYTGEKKMQDLFGLRVTAYFPDDTEIISDALKTNFHHISSTIDEPNQATFGPTRYNLIFALPSDYASTSTILKSNKQIDATFEVQLRTVLSEGWHEVEHDLRYKCKNDWDSDPDLYRALNGIVATLETCDWSMLKIFEEQAYRHYRDKRWVPMLRSKFRLRVADGPLLPELIDYFKLNPSFAKQIYRIDRKDVLNELLKTGLKLPLTWNNLIFISNYFFIENEDIRELEPRIVKASLDELPQSLNSGD